MNAYFDASALVKRYVEEPDSETVDRALQAADEWFVSRVGFVETYRAISLRAGVIAVGRFVAEWPLFEVIELDRDISERAATLAAEHGLRSLDAIHLASASVGGSAGMVVAAWDRRLHGAARALGHETIPERLA